METKDYIKNIENAERRFFASEVRSEKRDDNQTATIEGYAAKFDTETVINGWYSFREKILPGAFDDVLKDDIRCLFNHDPNYILARSNNGQGTLKLWVDEIGLKYSYETPDRSYAKDLEDAINRGDVSQSSFAFKIKEQRWVETANQLELREIVKFERLFDVSPVTYPAYVDTEVAKRSLDAYKDETKSIPQNKENQTYQRNENELNQFEAQVIINNNKFQNEEF